MVITLHQGRFPGFAKDRLTQAAVALMVSGQALDCLFVKDPDGNEEFRVRDDRRRPIYTVRRADGRYVLMNARHDTLAEGSLDIVTRLIM